MTIWANFFLSLIILSSEVQSQRVVPTSSPELIKPSATTTTGLTPSIAPVFGGAIPSSLPVPSTLRVSPPSILAIAPFTLPPILQNFPSPPAGYDVCIFCRNGFQVVNKKFKVDISGTIYTCEQIEAAGLRRQIPNQVCEQAFKESVAQSCGCQPIPVSRTKAPTKVKLKSPTKKPTKQ